MSSKFAGTGFLIGMAAILAALHFYGEGQRERDWWWIGGGPNHLSFVDISETDAGAGHILFVGKDDNGAVGEVLEVGVVWDCAEKSLATIELWVLTEEMDQIERMPPRSGADEMITSLNSTEAEALSVACASPEDRAQMQTFRVDKSPVKMTQEAFQRVSAGAEPTQALLQELAVKP